jgi:DNA-binding response OmpR family regulator
MDDDHTGETIVMVTERVLIVDDEAGVRFPVRVFLEASGYDVEEAASCEEAVDVFRQTRPYVAILDYKLPDGTASDLMPRLRELDEEVPIIVLTAHGSGDFAARMIEEGAEQFLTKPVELPVLRSILDRTVENQRNRQRQLAQKSVCQ